MNANLKRSSIIVAVVAVSSVFVVSSWAQSYLDGSAKARGDYGQLSRISRSSAQPMLRATAPSVTRSFSYEPAPAVKTDKAGKGADTNDKAKTDSSAKAAPNAAASTQSARSYSYEPSMGSASASAARSQTPLYLVPKSLR
ncbi:MAG TPA: hypothetical protein VGJ04_05970 [Pirellulales bacterium]|jgi:hypothetical protein